MNNKELNVLEKLIRISKDDYFSLTDIAKYKNKNNPKDVVKNWLRRKETIGFLGIWEN
ncbi:MAG: KilA-N domain-containing protein [Acholeplasmataceae bacterium]